MAEITMKIGVNNGVDMNMLQHWIALGVGLDTSNSGEQQNLAPLATLYPAPGVQYDDRAPPMTNGAVDPNAGAAAIPPGHYPDSLNAGSPAVQPAPQGAPPAGVAATPTAAADPVAPNKRGRKSNAQKAAEEAARQTAANGAAPPVQQAPPAAAPPPASHQVDTGAAIPPGMAPAPPVAVPTAMPQAVASPPPAAGQEMGLDDFRSAASALQASKPGKIMMVMVRPTWPDGTPKAAAFTFEAIPPAERLRTLHETNLMA